MGFNTYPYSPFPASMEQLHKGDNEDLQAQINAIKDGSVIDSFGDVETALDTKADNDVIAPEFDAEAGTYEIGDLVMYEGKLYEFTSAHETAGEWDSTEVTEKTVADEIGTVKSGLTNLSPDHVVLNIEANTYSDYGTALLHLNNAYLQLTNDQKSRAYLLVNYDGVFRTTSINAGYFSGIILGYDNAFYEIMMMYDFAHQKVFETSSNGATIEKTSDAQVSSLTLMY